jgi:hypothetical protein
MVSSSASSTAAMSSPQGSPTSQETCSATRRPPAFSSSASEFIAVIFPVCRGAYTTK